MRYRESMAMAVPITMTLNWPSKIIFYSISAYENSNRRKIKFCIDWYNYIWPMKKIHFSTVDFMSLIVSINHAISSMIALMLLFCRDSSGDLVCFWTDLIVIILVWDKTILIYQVKENDCVWLIFTTNTSPRIKYQHALITGSVCVCRGCIFLHCTPSKPSLAYSTPKQSPIV